MIKFDFSSLKNYGFTPEQINRASGISEVKNEIVFNEQKEVADIYLYGVIGGYFEGVSVNPIIKSLRAEQETLKNINLYINSVGGSVFDAVALRSALNEVKNKGSKINIIIDGNCASAATFFFNLGEVSANFGTRIMIHNAMVYSFGNKEELAKTIDILADIDDDISKSYVSKTGKDLEEIREKMTAETWFSAEEAKEFGFVDFLIDDSNSGDEEKNDFSSSSQMAMAYNYARLKQLGIEVK